MIDLDFIERLIQVLDSSGVDSLEIERGGTRIRLAKTPPASAVALPQAPMAAVAAAQPPHTSPHEATPAEPERAKPSSHLLEVTSPMVGTFYRSPAPDAPPYVETGSRVTPGDTLCIIEAMKLMNELDCEISGTIAEVCVDNGQPIEYGQVLFRVDPA